jgi:hypothetical protein
MYNHLQHIQQEVIKLSLLPVPALAVVARPRVDDELVHVLSLARLVPALRLSPS